MIFRAELSQNRQFHIIFEIQASNPVRNSCKLPHRNAKKRFLALKRGAERPNFIFLMLKRGAEAWNSGFNFYMTIRLTGQQYFSLSLIILHTLLATKN